MKTLLPCLALAAFLLGQRIASGPLPSGDEGSWLAAAAELSRGNGFSTRWLEYHYLEPYALPRPDDMRFPALVSLLALAMKILGPSYVAARALVAALYLAFMAAAWQAVRLRFGTACAGLTALLMALSPLQLEWSSAVYCEGLFGLLLALWLIALQKLPAHSASHGAVSGALIAALCLVRPNAVLLAAGLLPAGVTSLRPFAFAWRRVLPGLAALALILLPWLLRNALVFGDPLHVGGSAGLLRETHQETATLTLLEYLARYGGAYPVLRVFQGIPNFFAALHHYEHGLEILPLVGAALALLRRRPFFAPAAAWGFAAMAAACFYAGYNSWAGVRYFTAFLPFVYAYGLAELLALSARLRSPGLPSRIRRPAPHPSSRPAPLRPAPEASGTTVPTPPSPSPAATLPEAASSGAPAPGASPPWVPWALAAVLILPVVNPHRHYLRHYSAREPHRFGPVREYLGRLDASLPPGGAYLAASLCQVNYAGNRHCVGLQGPRREEWLPRALATFRPSLLALTPAELDGDFGSALLADLAARGIRPVEAWRNATGVILRLEAAP